MSAAANHTTGARHSSSVPAAGETRYLRRPEGRIGYDVAGDGSLVVLVPGLGDLRAGYRFLAPALRAAGYRVACTDPRGHGDSDATFASYGDQGVLGHHAHQPRPGRSAAGRYHGTGPGRDGGAGPDFPDPQAEAGWIARALRGQVVMVPEAGHYPQSQQPDITTGAILRFLESVQDRA
jgi:pimeloyl-ACP methyl ester carboxylesterase